MFEPLNFILQTPNPAWILELVISSCRNPWIWTCA
uniref:Uncharacterized protein n=1 Tax=Arundo donax TaxID=35708 RepID=A0A0A9BQG0_ARUDO